MAKRSTMAGGGDRVASEQDLRGRHSSAGMLRGVVPNAQGRELLVPVVHLSGSLHHAPEGLLDGLDCPLHLALGLRVVGLPDAVVDEILYQQVVESTLEL